MSVSPLAWKNRPPRDKCVHSRFRLQGGHDFQAVALDTAIDTAVFEEHYRVPLAQAESGYFETSAGMFEISNLGKPVQAQGKPKALVVTYRSIALGPPVLSEQEFSYVMQKKTSLRERHRQLQSMNEGAS